jgi:predicted metalloprotease
MFSARIPTSCVSDLLAFATVTLALAVLAGLTAVADPKKPNTSCAGWQLDNCYGESQMDQFLEVGHQMLTDYLAHIAVSSGPTLIYVPEGRSVNSQCGWQFDHSSDYCPASNTVFRGQGLLWDNYHQYGAAGPIAGLGHEYGHFLQRISDVPYPQTNAETIQHEDQADCVAGAFVKYLEGLGHVEYPQDFRNLGRFLRAIGSAEGPGRDHGTADERVHAFKLGLFGDLTACNRFYPRTPLAMLAM